MDGKIAVVMDVAGTMLRMYRVAKDLNTGDILERVVTWELIMAQTERALVVPQIDPDFIYTLEPDDSLGRMICGREDLLEVSCSSSPVEREEAIEIIRSSSAQVADLMDVHSRVRSRCPGSYHTAGMVVDCGLEEVVYALSTGGTPFPGMKDVLLDLKRLGADVYVASGDSMRSLSHLEPLGIDLSRVNPVSSPHKKREIVQELKGRYQRVVMVGDGLNDIYALRAADIGILTMQQDTRPSQELLSAADEIITNISQLPKILIGTS